jgi:hypothetical protein
MNWETIYNQHKDNLLIEEIEMKWRDEAAIYYPHTRLGGDSFFILCEDGIPLSEDSQYYNNPLLLEYNGN